MEHSLGLVRKSSTRWGCGGSSPSVPHVKSVRRRFGLVGSARLGEVGTVPLPVDPSPKEPSPTPIGTQTTDDGQDALVSPDIHLALLIEPLDDRDREEQLHERVAVVEGETLSEFEERRDVEVVEHECWVAEKGSGEGRHERAVVLAREREEDGRSGRGGQLGDTSCQSARDIKSRVLAEVEPAVLEDRSDAVARVEGRRRGGVELGVEAVELHLDDAVDILYTCSAQRWSKE